LAPRRSSFRVFCPNVLVFEVNFVDL